MSIEPDLQKRIARIETLLADRLNLSRGPLARRVAKAGRRLPRRVRDDLARLGEAAHLAGHPVHRLRLDTEALTAAAERGEAHLKTIDVADRRKGIVLGWLAVNAVNLLLLAALILTILNWRGFV